MRERQKEQFNQFNHAMLEMPTNAALRFCKFYHQENPQKTNFMNSQFWPENKAQIIEQNAVWFALLRRVIGQIPPQNRNFAILFQ